MSQTEPVGADRRVERRVNRRFTCDFGITIEWGAAELRGRVRDISAGGMFVELESPLWIGARFAAALDLREPVQLECVVRRVQPHRGMALSYAAPAASARAAIDLVIQEFSAQ